MSKVNILWMYDDLLDLYGDWGNLLAVTKGRMRWGFLGN